MITSTSIRIHTVRLAKIMKNRLGAPVWAHILYSTLFIVTKRNYQINFCIDEIRLVLWLKTEVHLKQVAYTVLVIVLQRLSNNKKLFFSILFFV